MADTQSQYIKYANSYNDKLLLWEKVLPMPPSVNNLYGYGRGGVHLKTEVVKFREQIKLMIGPICHTPYAGRLAMDIFVTPGTNHRRDMDNLSKCLLDALTKVGVYADDSQIDDVRIRRAQVQKDNPHVLVRMYRLNELKNFERDIIQQEKFYILKEICNGKEKEGLQICSSQEGHGTHCENIGPQETGTV